MRIGKTYLYVFLYTTKKEWFQEILSDLFVELIFGLYALVYKRIRIAFHELGHVLAHHLLGGGQHTLLMMYPGRYSVIKIEKIRTPSDNRDVLIPIKSTWQGDAGGVLFDIFIFAFMYIYIRPTLTIVWNFAVVDFVINKISLIFDSDPWSDLRILDSLRKKIAIKNTYALIIIKAALRFLAMYLLWPSQEWFQGLILYLF